MSPKKICRLCLATKLQMHSLADSPLKNIYEKLTGISLITPHRPLMACYICYSQLKKCDNLLLRSVRADRVLTQILHSGQIITEEFINTIDRETYQLNDQLSATPVELMSIESTGHNFMGLINNEESVPSCTKDIEVELKCDESEHLDRAELGTEEDSKDMVHVYVKCESVESETAVPENANIKTEDIDEGDIMFNKHGDAEKSVNVTVVLETDELDGAAPAEKCRLTKTRDRPSEEQNITEKQRKRKAVKEKQSPNKNISTYMSKNTKKATVTRTDTPIYSNTATNSGNVDSNSSKHLTNTIYCLLQHIEDNANKMVNKQKSAPQCSTSRQQLFNQTDIEKNIESQDQMYRFECDICQRRFAYKQYLVKHLRTHFRENPFKCTICQQGFNDERILKRHINKHAQGNILECATCSRTFTNQSRLNKHLEIHNKVKIFKCAICQRSFTYESTLKKHFKTHWKGTF